MNRFKLVSTLSFALMMAFSSMTYSQVPIEDKEHSCLSRFYGQKKLTKGIGAGTTTGLGICTLVAIPAPPAAIILAALTVASGIATRVRANRILDVKRLIQGAYVYKNIDLPKISKGEMKGKKGREDFIKKFMSFHKSLSKKTNLSPDSLADLIIAADRAKILCPGGLINSVMKYPEVEEKIISGYFQNMLSISLTAKQVQENESMRAKVQAKLQKEMLKSNKGYAPVVDF